MLKLIDLSDDRLRLLLGHTMGFIVVSGLIFVILRIALGKVEEATSYGLTPLVVALSNLSVMYGTWAWETVTSTRDGKPAPSIGSTLPAAK